MRGTAIVLVLLSHALEIGVRSLPAAPAWALALDAAFLPLRMPTMVFLSGTLLAVSIRKGPGRFASGKWRNIGYPYVVWTLIYAVTLQRDWYGDPLAGLLTFGGNLVTAPSPLWFLLFLMLFYALAYLLLRARVPVLPVVVVALLISVALEDGLRPSRFFYLFAFFMLGHWMTVHESVWERALRHRVVLVACAVLTLTLVAASVATPAIGRYDAEYAIAVLAAIVLLARAARAASGVALLRPLQLLGQYSLVPYVVHYPMMVATAALLVRFAGLDNTTAVVALTFLAGLAAGALAVGVRVRVPVVAWLFALPRRRSAHDEPQRVA